MDEVEEAHQIKSIIYVFDESNIDTYTFIETFHNELKKNHTYLFTKLKLPFILCNLSNILAVKSKTNNELPDNKVDPTAKIIEEFLNDNKELTYTFYSATANKIGPSNEQMNLVKNSFNKLVSKVKFGYYQIDRENTIRPMSRSKTLANLRSQSRNGSKLGNAENKPEHGGTYVGEVKNNLRNG